MQGEWYSVDVTIKATIRVQAPTGKDAVADAMQIQGWDLDVLFDRNRKRLTEVSVEEAELFDGR